MNQDGSNQNTNINILDEIQNKLSDEKTVNNDINSKIISRNQYFNKHSDISDMRNNIQTNEISLRKSTRNDEFETRRRFTNVLNDTSTPMKNFSYFTEEFREKLDNTQVKIELLGNYIENFKNNNIEEKFIGLVSLRKILTLNKNAPISDVVNAGLIPEFLELLNSKIYEFQYESLWCLTNISSGNSEDTYSIVNKNGIEIIIGKFDSNISEIQEQVIFIKY